MCIFVYKDINSQTKRKRPDDLGSHFRMHKKWGQQFRSRETPKFGGKDKNESN